MQKLKNHLENNLLGEMQVEQEEWNYSKENASKMNLKLAYIAEAVRWIHKNCKILKGSQKTGMIKCVKKQLSTR